MNWNYRVIEFTEPDGNKVRAIHEVFYEGGVLTSYAEDPAVILDDGDDPTVLFKILIRISRALLKDVIPAESLELKDENVKPGGKL